MGRQAARRCTTSKARDTQLEPSWRADVAAAGDIPWGAYAQGWWDEVIATEFPAAYELLPALK